MSYNFPVTTSTRSVERLADARRVIRDEARRVREAAGLSLTDVAPAIPADYSTVARWERGERVPRGRAALRYAQLIERLRRQIGETAA